MDNLENYLYILFAVIYIISRLIKARSKQKQQQQQAQPAQQNQTREARKIQPQGKPQRKKAFSFEDILKEFEKNLAGEEEYAHEKPLPVKEIRHEKPVPVVKAPEPRQKNPYEAYEGSDYTFIGKKTSEEGKEVFARNEKYSLKENVASEYIKMLRDPQGFKNAIVLSEIINRKYF